MFKVKSKSKVYLFVSSECDSLKYLSESGLFREFVEPISYDPPQIHWHSIATAYHQTVYFPDVQTHFHYTLGKYILNR